MRVALVAEQLRRAVAGGIGTYTRGLTLGLQRLDPGAVDVVLWASRAPRRKRDPVAALGPAVTSVLPSAALVLAWDRGWSPRPPAADVIHATSLAVPPVRSTPLSVMVHDLAWRRFPDAYPRRGLRWHEAALNRALRRGQLFLVPSALTAGDLVAAGASSSAVEVVEEGCDHLPPPANEQADALLAGLGVEPGEGFVLTVSTVEPRKNLARLAEAFEKARSRLPAGWPLVVVGPTGWGRSTPRSSDRVHLTGAVDDAVLAALYQRAAVFVYVPLWEGFGLPAVEAMHAGCPVVASSIPSTGDAALRVDPTDTGDIAGGIVEVAGDRVTRDQLVAAGHERAAALTWDNAARRHRELWEGLVGR